MQEVHTSPTWSQIVFYIVASFLGGGTTYKLATLWVERKKPGAEIHETEARADKARAEARRINADTDIQLSDMLERWHIRVDQMREKIDSLSNERDRYKQRADLQDIELRLRDRQLMMMKGILDSRGIKLSDFDEPK